MPLTRHSVLLAGLTIGLLPPSARSQGMDVPATIQIPILLKVLTYDRQLRLRAPETVVLAVAFQSGNRTSSLARDEVMKALAVAREQLKELPFRVITIDLDKESLPEFLAMMGVNVLYVAPLRGVDIRKLASTTRAARVTSITGVARYVELGLGAGLADQGGRPKILINLDACRLEGADFAAELLKLARIY